MFVTFAITSSQLLGASAATFLQGLAKSARHDHTDLIAMQRRPIADEGTWASRNFKVLSVFVSMTRSDGTPSRRCRAAAAGSLTTADRATRRSVVLWMTRLRVFCTTCAMPPLRRLRRLKGSAVDLFLISSCGRG